MLIWLLEINASVSFRGICTSNFNVIVREWLPVTGIMLVGLPTNGDFL